jgi:hypothetical protein
MKKETLMKHTPGPWKRIAIGKRQVISSGHGWLVEIPKRGEPETELQAKRLEADYDLMAAAPELLQVAKDALHEAHIQEGFASDKLRWSALVASLEDAIAKAEGLE